MKSIRSISTVFFAFVLFFSAGSFQNAHAQFIRGDTNGDGVLDIADAIATLGYLFRGCPAPACLEAADVDDNNSLSIIDALSYLYWLGGFGAAPALPFPGCGLDLTPFFGCAAAPACVPTFNSAPGLSLQFGPSLSAPGIAGKWAPASVTAQLVNNTTSLDVTGWSLSIRAKKGKDIRLLSATTNGTAAASPDYEETHVTRCGKGVVSSVVLSFTAATSLPPNGITPYDILALEVAGRVGTSGQLKFKNGEVCDGQPVFNKISDECGTSYKPSVNHTTINFVPGALINTPVGTNVLVPLGKDVWVVFDQVTVAGVTCADPPPPFNFSVNGTAKKRNIHTTASYTGQIKVCMRYKCGWPLATKMAAALFHNGVQVIPFTNDLCASVLCGNVSSFSPFSIVVPPEMVEFRRGDANGDGTIDLSDSLSILRCKFLNLDCGSCDDASDTNDDGTINLADATFLLLFSFRGGQAPSAPGPWQVGVDPTSDDFTRCSYDDGTEPEESDDDFDDDPSDVEPTDEEEQVIGF